MNANANDKRILDLKSTIASKKSKLKPIKFSPITNCSLELDGARYNIHTLNQDQLALLLLKLHSLVLSMDSLHSDPDPYFAINDLSLSGYSIYEWIADVRSKLSIAKQQQEQQTLSSMESKLKTLLSEDKKTELELNSIENSLNSI